MTYQRSFDLTSYFVLLAGFFSIIIAGGLSIPASSIFLVCLLAAKFTGPFQISRNFHAMIVASCLLIFALDYLALSDFGDATIHLLILLAIYKILTRSLLRDYLILYLISFALVLIASTYTISITYLATLSIFLFFSILTLILFESHQGYEDNPHASFSFLGFVKIAAVMTILVILIAVPIFFAIPRGTVGFFGQSDLNITGFSSSVNLGDIGRILQNSEIVMRVRVDSPPERVASDLKWRGIALNHYNGSTWVNTRLSVEALSPDPQGRFSTGWTRRQNESVLEQTIFLEPFTDVIFGASDIIQLFGFQGSGSFLFQDQNRTIFIRPRSRIPFRYVAHSDIRNRGERIRSVRNLTTPTEIRKLFLQLPEDLDPRIEELSRTVTENSLNQLAAALKIENFLKEQFSYSLSNPSGGRTDPLSHFLFESRSGHCEYFATAQAIMLRTVGIPSRIINGFRRGEYNEWGEYFIVRQSDAHSWVEAYFPGAGWIEFDPTPISNTWISRSWISTLSQILDSVEIVWTEIVTFDHFKQVSFFKNIRRNLEATWIRLTNEVDRVTSLGRIDLTTLLEWSQSHRNELIATLFCLAVLWLIYRYQRILRLVWGKVVLRRSSSELAMNYYQDLLRYMEKRGFQKNRSETPAEFGSRLQMELNTDIPLKITQTYYSNRFGGKQLTRSELRNIYNLLRSLHDL